MKSKQSMREKAQYELSFTTNEISIQEQQRDILLTAIDSYLKWRGNKNISDGRGYNLGLMTWLRHYTAFGEMRANNLKQLLSANPTPEPIILLQEHFKRNSKVNNHSLDTYILEYILENKRLFLISREFTSFNTQSSREELRSILINQDTSSLEYIYLIAKLYEEHIQATDHLKKACNYYAITVRQDHEASCKALNALAAAGNSEAQYILGFEYYNNCKGQLNEAINWCMQAAEQQHPQAIAYLFETRFSVEHYLLIARKYDQGDDVLRNIASAMVFYEKAYALNNKDAAFRLGQLCQPNLDLPKASIAQESEKDALKAFHYYLAAARQHDKTALAATVQIAEYLDNDQLRFLSAKVSFSVFSNYLQALTCFKHLAGKNIKEASIELSKLTSSNPEYAYIVAKLYEHDLQTKDHLKKACNYYAIAVKQDHEASCKALNALAAAGNSEAQYILGFEYYNNCKGQLNEAINWCMQAAEQQHPQAIAYLFETRFSVEHYLLIARKYDQGDDVLRNIASAMVFYEKAYALNNKDAAFRLGQLCQPNLDLPKASIDQESEKDALKAFHYYLAAARQHDKTALVATVQIAEYLDNDQLRFLSAQVSFSVFSNYLQALTCFKHLAGKNIKEASIELSKLTSSNPEYAYIVAKLYEHDLQTKDHLKKACDYYAIAVKRDHEASCKALNALAAAGNSEAQYILGFEYYNNCKGQLNEAINWCMQAAEQQHPQAIAYLFETRFSVEHYLLIARKYDHGNDVSRNMAFAMAFYEKASLLKNREAAFRLGQLYQIDHDKIHKDNIRSFHFYLQAAQFGHFEALDPLDRLADEMSTKNQLELSQIYANFFHNPEKANYWKEKAKEVDQFRMTP